MRGGGQMSRHQDVDTAPCQDRQGAALKLLLVKSLFSEIAEASDATETNTNNDDKVHD